jgi:hypothetical protein
MASPKMRLIGWKRGVFIVFKRCNKERTQETNMGFNYGIKQAHVVVHGTTNMVSPFPKRLRLVLGYSELKNWGMKSFCLIAKTLLTDRKILWVTEAHLNVFLMLFFVELY